MTATAPFRSQHSLFLLFHRVSRLMGESWLFQVWLNTPETREKVYIEVPVPCARCKSPDAVMCDGCSKVDHSQLQHLVLEIQKLRQTRLSHRPSGAMGTAFLLRCHCFPYLRQCLTSRSSSGHCLSIVLPLLSFSKAVPLPCGPPPQPVRMGRRARWRRGPSAPTSTISNRTRG